MSEALANLLAATAQLVEDTVSGGLERDLALTASAPAALVTLAHEPGLSIDALRRVLDLTHSGAVRLIDRLEADGLVERTRRGGRSVAVTLTRRGRKAVAEIERVRLESVAQLLAPLTVSERRELERVLGHVLASRTQSLDDLHRICRLCSFPACESKGRSCPVADAVG
jgi:DNA-binding MarR family transcriptional regulator